MYICLKHIDLPDPPVIDMVVALNNSSASLSWTPPPYNCSLINYHLEIVEEETNVLVVFVSDTNALLTTFMVGKKYTFRVASVDAAERMSNWSQPVTLAMQGLLFASHIHKIVNE